MLFDEDDVRIALNQPRNHFTEWFIAIHLFHTHGALSLIEKYLFVAHPRKPRLLDSIMSPEQQAILKSICADCRVQPPDLLVYQPRTREFWFAEAKGKGDRLSQKQLDSHARISRELDVRVDTFRLRVR